MRRMCLLACALAAGAGGCGVGDDRGQARGVGDRFLAALRAGDGGEACRYLSSSLRREIEKDGPCARGIGSLGIRGRRVARVQVFITDARVDVERGDTLFLDREREGWRLTAVGCKPRGDEPFDCEEES